MYQKVIIIGALGKDPELRYLSTGTAVCNLSVACNTREKIKDEWKDTVYWANVVVWGKQAESCSEHLAKGRQVFVEGKLQTRSWDKDGQTQYKTEIVARDVKFLGSKSESSSKQSSSSNPDSEVSDIEPF